MLCLAVLSARNFYDITIFPKENSDGECALVHHYGALQRCVYCHWYLRVEQKEAYVVLVGHDG